jgi:hypothetical protein
MCTSGLSINVVTLLHSCFIWRYHCTCIVALFGLQSSVVLIMFFADCRQRHECVIHVAAGCRQYRRHMSHQDWIYSPLQSSHRPHKTCQWWSKTVVPLQLWHRWLQGTCFLLNLCTLCSWFCSIIICTMDSRFRYGWLPWDSHYLSFFSFISIPLYLPTSVTLSCPILNDVQYMKNVYIILNFDM